MNLVILHPHLLYPGGASKYMLEVASVLVQKKLKISIVLTQYDKKLIKSYPKLKFIAVGGPSTGEISFWLTFPIFIFKLKRILDRIPDKILFPQIFPPVWWAATYKFFSPRTKVVWMCQEPSAFIHSPLVIKSLKFPGRWIAQILNPVLKVIDKALVKKIDFVIANSSYGSSLVNKVYQRKADLIAYPAVDLNHFKPQGEKKNYIFTISRLDKQKNVDFLIKAFNLLPDDFKKNYQLIIGGIGSEKFNLETLVKNLKLNKQVRFLGWVDEEDLPSWYAQAKMVAFCAQNEPFGIIPVEAMACGTPVVAFKQGGVLESVADGKTGILVEEKNEKKFSETMLKLLENRQILEDFSKNSRIHTENNFSWNKTADKIDKFLRNEVF